MFITQACISDWPLEIYIPSALSLSPNAGRSVDVKDVQRSEGKQHVQQYTNKPIRTSICAHMHAPAHTILAKSSQRKEIDTPPLILLPRELRFGHRKDNPVAAAISSTSHYQSSIL